MFDTDVGVNWHLKFRLKIEELQKENEKLKTKNNILERRIKKQQPRLIKIKTMKQTEASVSKTAYLEEHF